jgi:hypothetical protein
MELPFAPGLLRVDTTDVWVNPNATIAGRGPERCVYARKTLRFSRLLAVSRPWEVAVDHVGRAEVPLA